MTSRKTKEILTMSLVKQFSCKRLASATSLLVVASCVGFTPMHVAGQEAESPAKLDALDASREQGMKKATENNMKRIMLALHKYHGTRKTYPPAFTSKDSKPLLSWRVAILPNLDQESLYEEFHLDEPWDSEHNKTLIAKMPDVYRAPTSQHKDGRTVYLTPRGDRTAFPGEKAISYQQVIDGLSNTVALVEINDDFAIPWTQPDDWSFDPDDPSDGVRTKSRLRTSLERDAVRKVKPQFGGHYAGGFNAAFCDGSVTFISDKISDANVKSVFTRDGRELTELKEE